MIIKILFLLLSILINTPWINTFEKKIQKVTNKSQNTTNEKNIRTHIQKINKFNNEQKKIKIINIYNYIKKYFDTNGIKYTEYSLQEIGFVGYSQKVIYSKIKGNSKNTCNVIIPIEIQNNLKNNLAIGIAIELLNNLKNSGLKNRINFFFIEDDSLRQDEIISSKILLSNNYLMKNTNTLYLMLNEKKINNKLYIEKESNITNSKTNLSFLKSVINNFEDNDLYFSTAKIKNEKSTKIYNSYLNKQVPLLIINNNLKPFFHKKNKNNISGIYKSIENILINQYKKKNNNEIHYIIIDTPFKKIIIGEITLIILIYAHYNVMILVLIKKFKETKLTIQEIRDNYYKLVKLFFCLLISTYASLLITNKTFSGYENTIYYNITNLKYFVNFLMILFIYNLSSLSIFNFKIHMSFIQLKYFAIFVSAIELIILMYIKIESILIIILKSTMLLIQPNKNKIIQKVAVIIIWTINFTLMTSIIQQNMPIKHTIAVSYLISICLFSTTLINISEQLKYKINENKQNLKKIEKLNLISSFLIILFIIITSSSDMNKISKLEINQIINYPEKNNKIKIEYKKENKNPIQIISNNFNLILNANEQILETNIKAPEENLMNVYFEKTNADKKSIYRVTLFTTKNAKKIELHLKNASKLIIYQSNNPYKILSNKIVFSLNDINSKITTITFTLNSQDDIEYYALADFQVKKNQIKIYDKKINKEEKNIKIDHRCTIQYSGILPKSEKYSNFEYLQLQNDKEIDNLKDFKIIN